MRHSFDTTVALAPIDTHADAGSPSAGLERSLAMSVFTEEEREYLLSGVRLGRLATVGSDGTPHVVPTAFRYNADRDTVDIGGHDFAKRKKYRDVLRNPKVAFVVDDIASVSPGGFGALRSG